MEQEKYHLTVFYIDIVIIVVSRYILKLALIIISKLHINIL